MGWLKKAFKKVKKSVKKVSKGVGKVIKKNKLVSGVAGAALSFVPGGGIVKAVGSGLINTSRMPSNAVAPAASVNRQIIQSPEFRLFGTDYVPRPTLNEEQEREKQKERERSKSDKSAGLGLFGLLALLLMG